MYTLTFLDYIIKLLFGVKVLAKDTLNIGNFKFNCYFILEMS